MENQRTAIVNYPQTTLGTIRGHVQYVMYDCKNKSYLLIGLFCKIQPTDTARTPLALEQCLFVPNLKKISADDRVSSYVIDGVVVDI